MNLVESLSIKWNHLIEDSLKIKELEHVRIEKVEQVFREMFQRACRALNERGSSRDSSDATTRRHRSCAPAWECPLEGVSPRVSPIV